MVLIDLKTILLHPDLLLCTQPFFRKLKKSLLNNGIQPLEYARYNSPFVFRGTHGQPPQLLSHHFVYLLLKNSGKHSLLVREVLTQEHISEVLAIDKLNGALLEHALSGQKSYTPQSLSHQKRRFAQQVCPLCPGLLTGQKSKEGKIKDGKEYFEVKCLYRHYRRYNCDFYVELEKSEYILFKKNMYATNKWLNKLETKRCPLCKDFLFERKAPDGKVFQQCRKTLIRQFPGEDHCNYRSEITR